MWASVVNSGLAVFWQILYILASPGLLAQIQAEIAPYIKRINLSTENVTPIKDELQIRHKELYKRCPLLRATYFETLRMSSRPWSVRQIQKDIIISERNLGVSDPLSYFMKAGEFLTIPHHLHMKDPVYFPDPERFCPDRFLVKGEDGVVSVSMSTIRPYGAGKVLDAI